MSSPECPGRAATTTSSSKVGVAASQERHQVAHRLRTHAHGESPPQLGTVGGRHENEDRLPDEPIARHTQECGGGRVRGTDDALLVGRHDRNGQQHQHPVLVAPVRGVVGDEPRDLLLLHADLLLRGAQLLVERLEVLDEQLRSQIRRAADPVETSAELVQLRQLGSVRDLAHDGGPVPASERSVRRVRSNAPVVEDSVLIAASAHPDRLSELDPGRRSIVDRTVDSAPPATGTRGGLTGPHNAAGRTDGGR